MNKLKHAQHFLANGIAVIPLCHRGKEPQSNFIGGKWEQYKNTLPTENDLMKWFGSDWQNYGVVAGWRNLCILDFDNQDTFDLWHLYYSQFLFRVYETIPYIVKTARGAHVYISYPPGGNNQKRVGVDVKFHGYVVGPGSIHPSGFIYEATTDFHLMEVFSLDTLLPPDLFPLIAEKKLACNLALPLSPPHTSHTEYDAFVAASALSGEDLITKVKRNVRIENFFSNIQRTSSDGRWFITLCPFHDDHNPSMWIDARRQLCGCQTCGMKPMDCINLYSRMYGLSESVAVTALAQSVGVWG